MTEWITGREGARILGCSESWFYSQVAAGVIASVPYGEVRKFSRDDTERARRDADQLIGPGEAAAILAVSVDTLRRRTREGTVSATRTKGGHLRYDRDEVARVKDAEAIQLRPPGVQSTRPTNETLTLNAAQQQECWSIAEAVAKTACGKWKALDYDEALSDAMLGIAVALSRPSEDVPWNVSCYNHARWHVLKGIRKASGVSSRAYDKGVRYETLSPDQQRAVSLDATIEREDFDETDPLDDYERATARSDLDLLIASLPRRQRIVLVNTCAHQFTDDEVAADLGISRQQVTAERWAALDTLSRWIRTDQKWNGYDWTEKPRQSPEGEGGDLSSVRLSPTNRVAHG